MMTKTGTVAFSAPEIFTQQFYDEKVDIWSAATVLYMMLSGEQPFFSDNVAKLVQKITNSEIKFTKEIFSIISDEAKDLMKQMLEKDPSNRPSAQECLDH